HADRVRPQMRVESIAKTARHEMLGDVAMRHLTERVHTGIGAASAMHAHLFAADRFHSSFQRALHRWAVLLNLPAAKGRAVIFDDELVAGHQDKIRGGLRRAPDRNALAGIGDPPAFWSS